MQISDYNVLLSLVVIHLYLAVLTHKKFVEQPRDWVSMFLVVFAFVVVGRVLNDLIEYLQLPFSVLIMLFLIYIGLFVKVYYDYKRSK